VRVSRGLLRNERPPTPVRGRTRSSPSAVTFAAHRPLPRRDVSPVPTRQDAIFPNRLPTATSALTSFRRLLVVSVGRRTADRPAHNTTMSAVPRTPPATTPHHVRSSRGTSHRRTADTVGGVPIDVASDDEAVLPRRTGPRRRIDPPRRHRSRRGGKRRDPDGGTPHARISNVG